MLSFSPSCFLLYTIISVTFLFCCLPLSIATGSNETDKLALLQIKAQIRGDPLGVTSSWNDTLHFCEWYGATCGHKHHQRVTSLALHSSKLTGTLSPHLGNLSFLRELYLYNNSFSGTIPPEISRLHRLQTLWLTNNSIGGEIPSNISSCNSLVYLQLGNNMLVGDIPPMLGSLSRLQVLALSKNNLTGNIPSSLGNLSSLVKLYMHENNFFGSISASIGKLNYLTSLALGTNKLSGVVPPSIFNLSSLIILDLGWNDLEGELPSNLGNTLPHLQWFSVAANRFTGHIPTSISNSSSLKVLELSLNNLRGQVPPLNKLVNLTLFNIFQNFLGSDYARDSIFFNSLANATSLQWFEIGKNKFKGVFPKIFCNFSSLNILGMDGNFLAGEIPYCIENLLDLQYFGVSDNILSGIIPPGIGKLQKLIYIILDKNQLSGVIPPSIGNLTKLSIFGLFNNNLKGQIPSTLGNCGSLIRFSLSNNSLSGWIPPQLFRLSSLSIELDLSGNQLTGFLPEEVGHLTNLDRLDVSRNMLSGQLPNSLASCIMLEYLYMEGNHFQGTIPNLSALKSLVELNLSNNNFSGKIPQFLRGLKLQSLDLSNNNLEGEVPIDGVFKNASGVYVSGNSKLCGGIPELKLPLCNHGVNNQKKVLTIATLSGLIGVVLILAFLVLLYIFWQKKKTKKPTASDDSKNFPNLSYQMLLKATNGFSSDNLIGSGTFGDVYKGVLEELQSTVAIKVFNLQNHGAFKSFMAECGVTRNIRHRNLLKVVTACSSVDYQGRDFKALVYEYMANGSLDDWLHPPNSINGVEEKNNSSRHLSLCQRLDIAVDVAFSLDYLHNHCGVSIVHCDLKPSNVLLDDEMVAHVGDFGLAKFLSKGINDDSHSNQSSSIGVRGTIGYAPPEYGVGNKVTTSGDVYSFGILLLEMITGKRPSDDMFKGRLTLHDFVREALAGDVVEILDHVLLEDIDCPDSSLMLEALTCILEIALSCSNEVPAERLDMSTVSAKLSSIKKQAPWNSNTTTKENSRRDTMVID